MKVYAVGGSVRDELLGRIPEDQDYVIIGATEEEMLAKGLIKVGVSFPIFLDRATGDEYTLASSLEADLARRDLTINALAKGEDGKFIDPFGGLEDLRNKVLRHVREENFFEDPLRVLRAARLKAQLPGFTIHPETLALMKKTDCSHLQPERIIKELRKVFLSECPDEFIKTLETVNGMDFLKELQGKVPHLEKGNSEHRAFSLLVTNLSLSELDSIRDRLGIQNDWYEFACAWILFQSKTDVLDYFYAIDAFRKPWLVDPSLQEEFDRVKNIGIADIEPGKKGPAIAEAIRAARAKALRS